MRPSRPILVKLMISMLMFIIIPPAAAQTSLTDTLSVSLYFKQGKSDLDLSFIGNKEALDEFINAYNRHPVKASTIRVIGYASPEGPVNVNQQLSRQRVAAIVNYLQKNCAISADSIESHAIGVDWDGLYDAVSADFNVPKRNEVLDIIRNIPDIEKSSQGKLISKRQQELMHLDNGYPWNYMLKNIYPHLRGAHAEVICIVSTLMPEPEITDEPAPAIPELNTNASVRLPGEPFPLVYVSSSFPLESNPIYWSLHTNMLFDILGVPNIGAEIYLGKNISLAGNWWYAWWDSDRRHRYWRTYGGYIAPRFWLGKASKEKPLTGHHLGVYGQMMLYDFEWGGIGNLSGIPGKNIFHNPSWAVGIEYGFSLPIKRRLNLDFTIGLGYLWGEYMKYQPMDGHYVWLSTHNRRWFGPTKIEVSLVWLLGKDNFNAKKGGAK